jgi:hypothetical protein
MAARTADTTRAVPLERPSPQPLDLDGSGFQSREVMQLVSLARGGLIFAVSPTHSAWRLEQFRRSSSWTAM